MMRRIIDSRKWNDDDTGRSVVMFSCSMLVCEPSTCVIEVVLARKRLRANEQCNLISQLQM